MAQTAILMEEWDDEVEAVLAEFDGDPRRAIRALLDDIAALAGDRPAPPAEAASWQVRDDDA